MTSFSPAGIQPTDLQLARYLCGEPGPNDVRAVEEWAAECEDNAAELTRFRAAWPSSSGHGDAWDVTRLRAVVVAEAERTEARTEKKRPSFSVFRYGAVAAASVLLVAAIAGISRNFAGVDNTAQTKTYATRPGQRATITLQSGVQMTLAPATTAQVTANEVRLDGQAVFTVVHQSETPLTVQTPMATVRVLGTVFGVRAYSDEQRSRVIVAEGKVTVAPRSVDRGYDGGHGDAVQVLATGDIADIASSTELTVVRGENVSGLLAWAQGMLVFSDAPAGEVIDELTRWYGIEMQADRALHRERITMTLATESPEQAIQYLAGVLGARVQRKGNTVVLTPTSSRGVQ